MPEVLAVSDRIEVLRMGHRVARFTAAEATVEKLVGAMTGALTTEDTDTDAEAAANGAAPATGGDGDVPANGRDQA
jgi:ABC-type sugar transport system ATPase subunit